MNNRYFVLYWFWGLLYTVRDDGGNTSIFDPDEVDKVVGDLIHKEVQFAMKVPIPENWSG